MTKIDLYCGMLGVGKTTVIRQLLTHGYETMRVAIIENEVGAVNLDAAVLSETGITVTELTSGCVCCTIRGQLGEALVQIAGEIGPDVIIMEPSGAADIRGILEEIATLGSDFRLGRCVMIAPVKKIKPLLKIVGDFYKDQISLARTFFLNRTEGVAPEVIAEAKEILLSVNPELSFVAKPISELVLSDFRELTEEENTLRRSSTSSLELRDLAEPKKLEFGKKKDSILYTWKWDLPEALTEAQLDVVLETIKDTDHLDLWRAKGLLSMADGTVRKIDLVFGDLDEADFAGETPGDNCLVLIGKQISRAFIEEARSRILSLSAR